LAVEDIQSPAFGDPRGSTDGLTYSVATYQAGISSQTPSLTAAIVRNLGARGLAMALADIRRMTSGMIGNLHPSGDSGKPEPADAGCRWVWDEPAQCRLSNTVKFFVIKTHFSCGFRANA
jgi:hypothetical protein